MMGKTLSRDAGCVFAGVGPDARDLATRGRTGTELRLFAAPPSHETTFFTHEDPYVFPAPRLRRPPSGAKQRGLDRALSRAHGDRQRPLRGEPWPRLLSDYHAGRTYSHQQQPGGFGA